MATITTNTNFGSLTLAAGEDIAIEQGAILTVDAQVPADAALASTNRSGIVSATNRGTLRVLNNSTTTPLVFTMLNNGDDLRFEKNGKIITRGAPIQIGTGTGATQSFDFTAANLSTIPYPSLVEVETASGSNDYLPWIVICTAGKPVTIPKTEFAGGNSLKIGNVLFWNATTRQLESGDDVNGNVIPSGARVRIPNIYFHSDVITTNGTTRNLLDLNPSGEADLEWTALSDAFYLTNTAWGNCRFNHFGVVSQFVMDQSNFNLEIDHVAANPDCHQNTISITQRINNVLGQLSIKKLSCMSGGLTAQVGFSLASNLNFIEVSDLWTVNRNGRDSANDYSLNLGNLTNPDMIIKNLTAVGGRIIITDSANVVIENIYHADRTDDVNQTALPTNVLNCANAVNVRVVGLFNAGKSSTRNPIVTSDANSVNVNIYGADYDGFGSCAGFTAGNGKALGIFNSTLRNMRGGQTFSDSPATNLSSEASVVNCRATSSGIIFNDAINASVYNLCPGNPLNFLTSFNGGYQHSFVNLCDNDLLPTQGSVVFGPFGDYAGLTLTGNASFDKTGGIEMPSIGDAVEAESYFALIGVTAFRNDTLIYTYTDTSGANTNTTTAPAGLTFEFRIKTKTGNYGSYQAYNTTNLASSISSLVGYNSNAGFFIQMRVTATTDDALRIFNKTYFRTDIDNTYRAPNSVLTIRGASVDDEITMYRFSDDAVLNVFTGSGEFEFDVTANFRQEVYFIRRDVDGFEIMRTRSNPQALLIGDNGFVDLFAGKEVQLAENGIVQLINDKVNLYLDAAISSRQSEILAASRALTNQTEHDATQTAISNISNYDDTVLIGKVDVIDSNVDAIKAKTDTLVNYDDTTINTKLDAIPTTDSVADLTPVLTAIGNLNDITTAQIRTELATELARLDVAVSSVAYDDTALTALVDALPTLVEMEASSALTAIADVTGLSTHDAADVVTALNAVASNFQADISSLETKVQADARQAILVGNQTTINEGVKKASKLQPHSTDL